MLLIRLVFLLHSWIFSAQTSSIILLRSALLNLSTPVTSSLPVFFETVTREARSPDSSSTGSSSSFAGPTAGLFTPARAGAAAVLLVPGLAAVLLAVARAAVVDRAVVVIVRPAIRVVAGARDEGFVTAGATRETVLVGAPRPRLRLAFANDFRAADRAAVGRIYEG